MFRFKQFSINQDQCGMKISSVATVLGGLIEKQNAETILDIGTGTGLLSLMLAQRITAHITAIEIDTAAANQAKQNFLNSPWRNRLSLIEADILTLLPEKSQDAFPRSSFDLIVCNPPFFQKKVTSTNPQRNLARHTETLTPEALAQIGQALLADEGEYWLLIATETLGDYCAAFQSQGFFLTLQYDIKDNPKTDKTTCNILRFQKTVASTLPPISFYLRDSAHQHSPQVRALLKEYLIVF